MTKSNKENSNDFSLPIVFLLDTSASMEGEGIRSLNQGIKSFKEEVSQSDSARSELDIAIVEFNTHAKVVQDFVPLSEMQWEEFKAAGECNMGEGIDLAVDMALERREFYGENDIGFLKPWIFMISAGAPVDDIEKARARIFEEDAKGAYGNIRFWSIGVPGYNKDVLRSLTKRCLALGEIEFGSMFEFLDMETSSFPQEPDLPQLPDSLKPIPKDW